MKVFERFLAQSTKCRFGSTGVCCRLCANGPCRVTEKAPHGVCGADRDVIVSKNFLRAVTAGSACYLHIVENSAEALKRSDGINGDALRRLAARLQVDGAGERELTVRISEAVFRDLYSPRHEKMKLTRHLAPRKEYSRWASLQLLPGGAKAEVFDALVKTSTNLSSNPLDLLLSALRLGIATGYYGLCLTNAINDALLGEPVPRFVPCGIGTINPRTLNVAITGHQQAVSVAGLDRLIELGLRDEAQKAGAEGVSVIGLTCVGQDMQSRTLEGNAVFSGHSGDNFTAVAVMYTGMVDLLLSDFNCTIAELDEIAREEGIPEVCVDDVAMLPHATVLDLNEPNDRELREAIALAVEHFRKRKGREATLPDSTSTTITGLTENNIASVIGGSLEPLLNLIKEGNIRGIAGVVGCSNLIDGHGFLTESLTRELIKRDILVLSAGCTLGVLANCGFMSLEASSKAGENLGGVCCRLGIPPVLNFGPCLGIGRIEEVVGMCAEALDVSVAELPVAVSAPEWLEEQALADGAFALALGLSLHLGSPPPITASPLVVDVLTNKMMDLTGGTVYIDSDAKSSAEWMVETIESKRRDLGI